MARVDLSSRLSALIPTDMPDPVASDAESEAPILTVVPGPAVEPFKPTQDRADDGGDLAAAIDPADTTSEATSVPKPRRRSVSRRTPGTSRARSTARSVADAGEEPASKGVGVLLPESLDARLRHQHDETKKSFPTIVMDAVESTYERLPDLIAKATGREAEPVRPSLFGRPTGAERRVGGTSEPTVRHTIRLSERNVKVLDDLTDEMLSPSRTLLLVTALDAYLPSAP